MADDDLKQWPVESVSWDACREFAAKLNKLTREAGWEYRLPTEDEWEYAARGGPVPAAAAGFDFYLDLPTNILAPTEANFNQGENGRPTRVDAFPPNRLSLYDLHGNVHQWCDSPVGPAGGPGDSHRVIRDGSFYSPAAACRATTRFFHPPTDARFNIGLRLVRVPVAK